jgi:hypothetical protein
LIYYAGFGGSGLLLSVPKAGEYEITFAMADSTVNGSMCYGKNHTTLFVVNQSEVFIDEVHFCPIADARRSRSVTASRRMSPRPSETSTPAPTEDRLDTSSIVAVSIGATSFLFAVFGLIILARCKNQCECKSEQGASVVTSDMMFTGNFGEPFAVADDNPA